MSGKNHDKVKDKFYDDLDNIKCLFLQLPVQAGLSLFVTLMLELAQNTKPGK